MRIRSHLLLVAAVVLVPGFIAAAIAVDKVRKAERDASLRGLRETVRATALLVDGEVQRSLGALTALGTSEHLKNGDLAAFYAQAKAIDRPPGVWTLLLDENGQLLINTAAPFGSPMPRAGAMPRVDQALTSGLPVVTDVFVGPATGKLLTTIYVPTRTTDGQRFVVAQAFAVEHWKTKAIVPPAGSDWIVAVIDQQGNFISRSRNADAFLGQPARPELVAAAAASSSGLIRHETREGIDAYDAFAHSSLTGWTVAVAAPVASIDSAAAQAVAWLGAGIALALAVALGAATLLGRVLIRAIDTASQAAVALGRGETAATPPTSIREVDQLNVALAGASRLLAAERTSRAAAEAERERLFASETTAREEAQRQNAAKDQFLALLGHELRTPLAAIAGATEMMARRTGAGAEPDRFLRILQRQGRHLRRIVDDLLEVSRMLSGKIELAKEPLDLAESVASCVEAVRVTDRAAGYRFVVQVAPVWIEGDPVRIEQIVNNLVTNALKYSPAGSEIAVRVSADAGRAMIAIADRGVGIDAELLPHIFEPFVQGPPVAGRAGSGLGIGLALVRQLVELHGGSVRASSAGEGQGSTLLVTLPRIERPAGASPRANAAVVAPAACRVLLVEDDVDARETTAELLRMMGYAVEEAADGAAAIAAVGRRVPDVLVMDIGLPDRDGYQIAAELRADPRAARMPMIALTGYGQAGDRSTAVAAGFGEHLVKPVELPALVAAIEAQRLAGVREST